MFESLRDLVRARGKTVIAVTHDLDIARRIALIDGAVVADERGGT